jgi:ABC-2 type transport system permease protein
MSNAFKVASHEFLLHVRTRRFLWALLSFPLIMGVSALAGYLAVRIPFDSRPVGYVDSGQILRVPPLPVSSEAAAPMPVLTFNPYPSEQAARQDLEAGTIQGYLVLPANYLQGGQAKLVSLKTNLSSMTSDQLGAFLQSNLFAELPAQTLERLQASPQYHVTSLSQGGNAGTEALPGMIFAVLAGFLFTLAIFGSGGYLLQSLAEEKENRTMEVLITSIKPRELLAGKIAGNLAVGLLQLLVWIAVAAALLPLVLSLLPIPGGLQFSVDGRVLVVIAITFLPAIVLVGGLMAAAGSIASQVNEAQQLSSIVSIPVGLSLGLLFPVINDPGGALGVILSLFPLSAPTMLPLRVALGAAPVWQIALSVGLLLLSAWGSILFATRVFRLGMLHYGKQLSFREIFPRRRAAKA